MTPFLSHDTPTSRSPRALLALVRCSLEKRREIAPLPQPIMCSVLTTGTPISDLLWRK